MNKKLICALLALSAVASMSVPAQAADFQDYARVLRVTPRTQQVNQPQEVCRNEIQRVERREESHAGALVGGVAGALLGSRFGRGQGRTAAAAAGAITGAIVGDNIGDRNEGTQVEERPVRRCEVQDNWVTRTDGYQVDYEYRGHQYTTVTPYEPGDRLQVRVSVVPAQ